MAEPAFRTGVATLGRRGLTLDAWVYHVQLEELVDLARAVPDTAIVLNHLGGPVLVGAYADRAADELVRWRSLIAEVATCPNVVLKVGGVGMEMFGHGWSQWERPPGSDEIVASWGDHLRFAIDTFGPSRCMFESNFPVDRLSCSYVVLWNAFKKLSAGYTAAERDDLMRGTAIRAYRLTDSGPPARTTEKG
jgi:predicted TIM-barrel fold metal-dependent hydrolase